MSIEIVRKFLALPVNIAEWEDEAWDLIREPNTFLSVDWGLETEEIIDQWNNIHPENLDISSTLQSTETALGYTHHILCGSSTISVPYNGSREDCFIAVLAINQLIKEYVEIRLCSESTDNSDWCFLPLSHITWKELEQEYGSELINRKFITLPETWNELERKL